MRAVILFGAVLICGGPASGALLVSLSNTGLATNSNNSDPAMNFSFDMGAQGGLWEFTSSQEGAVISAPANLLAEYDNWLTTPTSLALGLRCCGTQYRQFATPPGLGNGSGTAPVVVTRHAPVLGPNLQGYALSEVTMTIDDITIEQVGANRWNRSGAHTVRIYGEPRPLVPGDFNWNGVVDAADYVLWRNHRGQAMTLPNESGLNPGSVDIEDYNWWRAGYGGGAAGGIGTAAIPEPAGGVLVLIGLLFVHLRIRLPRS